ncbi:hypothetical protein [Catellatospora methionotrophica]|uniref:hypothetical protein n=1 Tax=Catellatospora methionotrophica TaxID=121620 RepID=UPI0033FA1131
MTDVLVVAGLAATIATMLGGFVWLAARVRRSGVGAQIMGPIDQLYRPAAHQFHQESRLGGQHGALQLSSEPPPRPER